MSRSFVRLVITSVVLAFVVGFVALVLYGQSQSWTTDDARRDGVFLVYESLEHEPAAARTERLQALRPHFAIEYELVSTEEFERRTGRPFAPGVVVVIEKPLHLTWCFLAFRDGQGALAAGPVHPAIPRGAKPIGIVLAVLGVPLIAALIVLRVQRELSKVERASASLAVGELSARVDNRDGPSSELAASFNAMAEQLERLIRRRDELVQAVSHELGSPLARLRFHTELLASAPEAQRDDRVVAMRRELDSLEGLVAELLDYVQSERRSPDAKAFAPEAGLRDLAELARLEAREGHDVDVEVAVPRGATLIADQRLFLRAIENLLRNAVHHARGHVRLELHEDADGLRVEVHDDGPGIPLELRDKVVLPFFRSDGARTRKTGGVGLGLAIVQRILEQHQGDLSVRTSPSLGGALISTRWPKRRA